MSRIVSTETRNGSEAGRGWRRDVEQWRNTIQRSLAETLTEVRELAESIEYHVQQESANRAAARATTTVPADAPLGASAPRGPTGPRTAANATLPDRNSLNADNGDSLAATQMPEVGAKAGTSEDRLAELARRLEEKLGRSNSRTSEG